MDVDEQETLVCRRDLTRFGAESSTPRTFVVGLNCFGRLLNTLSAGPTERG